ncbi:uncharacterized protein C1orf198 homolog [Lutzomyia longipalpis]|uniref:uncharacterized protein C1orf198 homolog n=1 Tax=Lutzomyia longipalpis TaxID=7200 RepID=UPI002483323B|nr:uncharacterized protein C1orf198 homolog [Lutzomyia longipalpis]
MEVCAAQYFSSLNAIAAKIAADAEATVASFEHLWNTMEPLEKASTLTDALIEPEVVLKYLRMAQEPPHVDKSELQQPANNQDEHGAPFLWHTRSQLDLVNLAQASPCGALLGAPTTKQPTRFPAKVSKPKAPPPPPPKAKPQQQATTCNEKSHAVVISSGIPNDDTEALVVTTEEEDDEPEERISAHSPATEEKSLLYEYSAKADYDFLNNW